MGNFTTFNISSNTVDWSGVQNASSFLQLANDTTSGWFWTAMYMMFLIIIFTIMTPWGVAGAFIATAFAGIIVGIGLLYMHLIGLATFLMVIAVLVITVILAGREAKN